MKMRVVIRDLKQSTIDGPRVVVGSNLSQREAEQMLKRFTKLKWSERRPQVYTIDHVALAIEIDNEN